MKVRVFAVVVAACASTQTPTPVRPVVPCTVEGVVRDAANREPLVGATVVLDGKEPEVALTDEHGRFSIPSSGAQKTILVYFEDNTRERPLADGGCGRPIEVMFEIKMSAGEALSR